MPRLRASRSIGRLASSRYLDSRAGKARAEVVAQRRRAFGRWGQGIFTPPLQSMLPRSARSGHFCSIVSFAARRIWRSSLKVVTVLHWRARVASLRKSARSSPPAKQWLQRCSTRHSTLPPGRYFSISAIAGTVSWVNSNSVRTPSFPAHGIAPSWSVRRRYAHFCDCGSGVRVDRTAALVRLIGLAFFFYTLTLAVMFHAYWTMNGAAAHSQYSIFF